MGFGRRPSVRSALTLAVSIGLAMAGAGRQSAALPSVSRYDSEAVPEEQAGDRCRISRHTMAIDCPIAIGSRRHVVGQHADRDGAAARAEQVQDARVQCRELAAHRRRRDFLDRRRSDAEQEEREERRQRDEASARCGCRARSPCRSPTTARPTPATSATRR